MATPAISRVMAEPFLPNLWDSRGAAAKANTAARKLEKVKKAIWAALSSQKKVVK